MLYPIAASSFIHYITFELKRNASKLHRNKKMNIFHCENKYQLKLNEDSINGQQGNNINLDIIV